MTVHVFLSPPRALTANETTRGVLLRWDPPARASVALSGYALELRQDKGGWEVLERSIPGTDTQVLVPGLIKVRSGRVLGWVRAWWPLWPCGSWPCVPQDAFYEFRLVAFAGSYISDPSNTVNVSTAGKGRLQHPNSKKRTPFILLPSPCLCC